MGTLERKAREKEQRRREILDAARGLFLAKGYAATTMPAIAEAAELAPGTLYLYFRSKESLYLELLDEGFGVLLSLLDAALEPDAPARTQAGAFIDTFFRFARENPAYFDVIFFVVQREGRMVSDLFGQAGVSSRLTRRQRECMQRAAAILARRGGALAPAGIAVTVDAVWGMLAGVVRYFVNAPAAEYDAVCGTARKVILDGLFPSSRKDAGKGGQTH